jgi:thymidylate kinase
VSSAPPPVPSDGRSAEPSRSPLEVLRELFAALEATGVRYCQWKSTRILAAGLAGETDLDLLVARHDQAAFTALLSERDFKLFESDGARRFPGIEDWLGFDAGTGRLVHLHVHYRLVLGEEYVKGYLLPIEDLLLSRTTLVDGVRVPEPDVELAVLAVRVALKYGNLDALHDRVGRPRRAGLPASTRREVEELRSRVPPDAEGAPVLARLPGIPAELLVAVIRAVTRPEADAAELVGLRAEMRAALAADRRLGRWEAAWRARRYGARSVPYLGRLLTLGRSPTRKRPRAGGVGIAFVGSDGSGKSSLVRDLTRWLGWRIDVRVFYMGSTQPSRPTRVVSLVTTFLSVVRRRDLAAAIRAVADARDRYGRYVASRRAVGAGSVVIYDRYPLPGVRIAGHEMDAARIPPGGGRVARALSRFERRAYARIARPEALFVLVVSPEVALARKPGHREEIVRAKTEAVRGEAATIPGAIVVDADRPYEEVLLEVKRRVWDLL